MAEKKEIEYILNLYHREFGSDGVLRNLEKLVSVSKNVQSEYKGIKAASSQVETGFKQLGTSIHTAFGFINSIIKPLTSVGFSLHGVVKANNDLNKSVRSIGSEFLKYGIGFAQLENRVNKFAIANKMLRTEVLSLASSIQSGFRDAAGNFENIIKLFEKVVGNNPQAIQQQINSISSLSNEYIGLGRVITSVGSGGNLSSYQKDILSFYSDIGDVTGKLNKQQSDQIQDLIASQMSGSKYINEADVKRKKEIDDQIAALRTFEQTQERIAITLSQQVMPVIQKIANFIQDFNGEIVTTAKYIGIAVTGLSAMHGVLNALSGAAKVGAFGLGWLRGAGVAGSMAGAAGAAGAAGSAGISGSSLAAAGGGALSGLLGSGALMAGSAVGGLALGSGVARWTNMYGTDKYISSESSLRQEQFSKRDASFRSRERFAKSAEEISLINSEKQLALIQEQLDKERSGKIGGFYNDAANAWYGGSYNRTTSKEKNLMDQMKEQSKIVQENKSIYNSIKKLNDEKERLDTVENIKKIEKDIFELEKSATPLRQKQRLEMDLTRQNLESQKGLMQSQLGLITSMAERMKSTGRFSPSLSGGISNYLSGASSLFKENLTAQSYIQSVLNDLPNRFDKMRSSAASDISSAAKTIDDLNQGISGVDEKINRSKDKSGKEYLELLTQKAEMQSQVMASNARKTTAENIDKDIAKILRESQQELNGLQKELNDMAASAGQEMVRSFVSVKDKIISIQNSAESLAQSQVSLADNLAMGLAASSEMRMQVSDQIAKSIDLLQQKMMLVDQSENIAIQNRVKAEQDILKAKNDIEKQSAQGNLDVAMSALLEAEQQRLEIQNQILGKQQQQAQLLRTLRDGYISAINAMNTGAGVFSKIIVDQNKNLGILMQQGLSPTGIRTGSSAGGFVTSERFTPTGISSSAERRMFPIVKPEWGLDTGFSGINGRGSLQDIAKSVSEQIPSKVSQMSADMSAVAGNVSNLSRLFGADSSSGYSNLKDAKNSTITNIGETALEHIDRIRGNRSSVNTKMDGSSSSLFSSSDKKEIAKMISKEIGYLIKDAVIAAKEDIMSEIHKGLG